MRRQRSQNNSVLLLVALVTRELVPRFREEPKKSFEQMLESLAISQEQLKMTESQVSCFSRGFEEISDNVHN